MEVLLEPTSNKLLVGTNDGVAASFQRKKVWIPLPHTSANSDKQDLPLRYQVYQGRLLASFQKDAKYEHVGKTQIARWRRMIMMKDKDLKYLGRDEHQYHIDQMKNFLKSDIFWESRKEILASSHPRKTTPLVQSCQRDPEAPALSQINQDLLYLKKGNSGPKKIVLSLHKFPAIIFNNVDIEEWTSRWVNKCVKKFNPYARYGVEHWKNPHAKIFYIKRQKELENQRKLFIRIQRSFKLSRRTRNWAMNTSSSQR
ncbi:hypothetical protein Tco_0466609 [Tanacetum coccineum]